MEWIDVNDRLPESGSYLILYKRERVLIAEYNYGKFMFNIFSESITKEVTHWMPLPQPPIRKE